MSSIVRANPLTFVVSLISAQLVTGCTSPDDDGAASASSSISSVHAEWRRHPAKSTQGIDFKCADGPTRLLCFGGGTQPATTTSSVTPASTYELLADGFSELSPASAAPPGRTGHAFAYDPQRKRHVLFGGARRQGVLWSDTWTFDGTVWKEEYPAHAPPPREDAAFAEDIGTGRLVLFGGHTELGSLHDLWEWDGVDWTERAVPVDRIPKGTSVHATVVPAHGILFYIPKLNRDGQPAPGKLLWYHDGVFTTPSVGAELPAAWYGAITFNHQRETLEAFLVRGRTSVFEGTLEGNGIRWEARNVTEHSPYDNPGALAWAAWDPSSKTSVVEGRLGGLATLQWRSVSNEAPRIAFMPPQKGFAEDRITFTVDVRDPDDAASSIQVQALGLPEGARFDPPTRTFEWTPAPHQKGTHTVQIVATDGEATTARDVDVIVHWNDYAFFPKGPIDQLTSGDGYTGGFFNYKGDPKLIVGLLELPAVYQECKEEPFQWCETNGYFFNGDPKPGIMCRYVGKNPGKVTASCAISVNLNAYSTFAEYTSPVDESGRFSIGTLGTISTARLIDIPHEGLAAFFSGYEYRLQGPLTRRVVQTHDRTSLLRPTPK